MIGDTNLFFNEPDDPTTAEAEIMIAEESNRGQKLGWEAMLLMLRYGMDNLKVTSYQVKINLDNASSIRMFSKLRFQEVRSISPLKTAMTLKYLQVSRSQVFQQVTMGLRVQPDWKDWVVAQTQDYVVDENWDCNYWE